MLGNPNTSQGERSLEDTEKRESRGGGGRDPSVSPISQKSLPRKSANIFISGAGTILLGQKSNYLSLFILGVGKDGMLNSF